MKLSFVIKSRDSGSFTYQRNGGRGCHKHDKACTCLCMALPPTDGKAGHRHVEKKANGP